jgi:hypothetical protein
MTKELALQTICLAECPLEFLESLLGKVFAWKAKKVEFDPDHLDWKFACSPSSEHWLWNKTSEILAGLLPLFPISSS